MPPQPLRATIITLLLDEGVKLQEALRFAEVRCCAGKAAGSELRDAAITADVDSAGAACFRIGQG